MKKIVSFAAAAGMLVSAPAFAHPKLVNATPAANATVKSTRSIELQFSEKLVPAFSGADVVMTGMPGMPNHGQMKMGAKSSVSKDGKTLLLLLAKPLPRGDYRVNWHAVAGDTHRITGTHAFKVR
ncbi:MAG TPA: copper homeostasis periplasmic binding protein CopC [Rhizorhapis sp.]|nr:copper homeostasis periplasmic binding protein CopC [Rhizorhapis sp.]